jgi:hydroxyacylglutathione hydrolase
MDPSALVIEPFVDEQLGNSAYLIALPAAGSAVLVDPLRDVDRYVAAAERRGLRISHVLETHLHNDFISGARELAAGHGAVVAASAGAGLGFDHRPLAGGDALAVGQVTLRVLATPGHTPEHVAYTIGLDGRPPAAVFSGGALIVGGAARTDLLGHEHAVPLARQLFHSLHEQLLTLPDTTAVYPTHGAGSFCAAPASKERTTTIGRERAGNSLARLFDEADFVEQALAGLPSYPIYYQYMRAINRRGPRVLGGLPPLAALAPEQVQEQLAAGAALLDVRPPAAFAEAHIPGSYGIANAAPLVTWAGWLIPFGTPLVLVAASPAERETAVRQLIRIGYDELRGFLDGGLAAWEAAGLPLARLQTLPVAELRERLAAGAAPPLIDVRQAGEWQAGHIPGAIHIENGRLALEELPFPRDQPLAIHCHGADRSTAAISVLARRGYTNLVLVEGGFRAWRKAGFEIVRD